MSVTLKARYRAADAKGKRALKGYYVVFRDPGRTPAAKEVPTGTRERRVAEARRVEAERAHALGIYDPWVDSPPWRARSASGLSVEVAVERFLASRTSAAEGRACRPATVRAYRVHLAPLLASLPAGLALADLTREHVERYRRRAAATVRPATMETYARSFRVFATWCRRAVRDGGGGLTPPDWMPDAPARLTRAPHDEAPKYFTGPDLARLVETARAMAAESASVRGDQARAVAVQLPIVVAFTAATGLRLGEVCALVWGDVTRDDDGRPYVHVVSGDRHVTKSGRSRTVPLVGDAVAAIEHRRAAAGQPGPMVPVFALQDGLPLGPTMVSRAFRTVVDATFPAGDGPRDRRSFHSLRHTFGTAAVGRGVDVYAVQVTMGHATAAVTQRYAKHLPAGLHKALSLAFDEQAGEA